MKTRKAQACNLTDFLRGMSPHPRGGMPNRQRWRAPSAFRVGGISLRGPVSFLWSTAEVPTTEYVARLEGMTRPALGGGDRW